MSNQTRQRDGQQIFKCGGYASSSKPASQLKRPPAGAAPGAAKVSKPAKK